MQQKQVVIRQSVPYCAGAQLPFFSSDEDQEGYRHVMVRGPADLESPSYIRKRNATSDGTIRALVVDALATIPGGGEYEPLARYQSDDAANYLEAYDLPHFPGADPAAPCELTFEQLQACRVLLLERCVMAQGSVHAATPTTRGA
jgi:hypothetical protein